MVENDADTTAASAHVPPSTPTDVAEVSCAPVRTVARPGGAIPTAGAPRIRSVEAEGLIAHDVLAVVLRVVACEPHVLLWQLSLIHI